MIFYIYIITQIFEVRYIVIKRVCYFLTSLWVILLGFTELYLGENFPHQIGITLCLGYIYLTVVLTLDSYISTLSLHSSYYTNKNRVIKIY